MPAEVLFAGGRLDSLEVIAGVATEITTAGRFDSAYADSAINIANTADRVQASLKTSTASVLSDTTVVSGETLWCHWENYVSGLSNSSVLSFILRDSAGFDWFRIVANGSQSTYTLQWNSGTGASPVWTTLTTAIVPDNTRQQMDLSITLGSPNVVNFYTNGNLIATGSFTQALLTDLQKVIWGRTYSTVCNISQILLTRDIPTIGAKVRYSRATANGANTAWAGVFTDVNEAISNDVTLNSSATAAQRETHAMGDITLPTGYIIDSVWQWLRAKNDGVAPNNIRSALRSGGSDYVTGNLSGVGVGFAPVGAKYALDPATAIAWTQAGVNAVEAGYESAT